MMFRKSVGLFLICWALGTAPAWAAKARVWTVSPVASVTQPGMSAALTGWKQYLKLSFWGVAATRGIDYELVFSGNGNEQGIFGSVKPGDKSKVRSLFLGTCSHGACTAYRNIGNLHLTITYKMKNGTELIKRYKIKY